MRDDPGGHPRGRAGWVARGVELDHVKADHPTASRYFHQDSAQLPVAQPARLGERVPRGDRGVEHVEIDRDIQRVRLRHGLAHNDAGSALEYVARSRPAPSELPQSVHLNTVNVAKP